MTMIQTNPTYSPVNIDEFTSRVSKRKSFLFGVMTCVLIIAISNQISGFFAENNGLKGMSGKPSALNGLDGGDDQHKIVEFTGIQNAEWCVDPVYDPLPFERCKSKDFLFRFSVSGGLTNALNFILKGALWAYEENACYFVDEKGPNPAQMAMREDGAIDPFLGRYFEPLSLQRDHPKVQWAMTNHKFIDPDYYQIQHHEYGLEPGLRKIDDPVRHRKRDLQPLHVHGQNNIQLKKWMLRRLFRIKQPLRQTACSTLNQMGLNEEYIAMSIRRGDKHLEREIESSLQPYIDKAQTAIDMHFGGRVPLIFVASDDCSVMTEIRGLRPGWKFVGPCDNASEENGFILTGIRRWTVDQTDKHYTKFVTEMIAMASAKHFIGVSTTSVSFWVYFMRHMNANDETWEYVDTPLFPF